MINSDRCHQLPMKFSFDILLPPTLLLIIKFTYLIFYTFIEQCLSTYYCYTSICYFYSFLYKRMYYVYLYLEIVCSAWFFFYSLSSFYSIKKFSRSQVGVVPNFNPSNWEAISEFKDTLVYRVSSPTARTTQRNLSQYKKKTFRISCKADMVFRLQCV